MGGMGMGMHGHAHGGHKSGTFKEPTVEIRDKTKGDSNTNEQTPSMMDESGMTDTHKTTKKDSKKDGKKDGKEKRRLIQTFIDNEAYDKGDRYEYRMERCVNVFNFWICLVVDALHDVVLMRYMDGDAPFVSGYWMSNEWIVDDIDMNACRNDLLIMIQNKKYDQICIVKQNKEDELSIVMQNANDLLIFSMMETVHWNEMYYVNTNERILCRE
eukprot:239275_1